MANKLVEMGIVNIEDVLLLHGKNEKTVVFEGKEMYHINQKAMIYADKELINRYKLVLATSSLTIGCNFDKDDFPEFTHGIHLYTKFIPPTQFIQAIHRFRAVDR